MFLIKICAVLLVLSQVAESKTLAEIHEEAVLEFFKCEGDRDDKKPEKETYTEEEANAMIDHRCPTYTGESCLDKFEKKITEFDYSAYPTENLIRRRAYLSVMKERTTEMLCTDFRANLKDFIMNGGYACEYNKKGLAACSHHQDVADAYDLKHEHDSITGPIFDQADCDNKFEYLNCIREQKHSVCNDHSFDAFIDAQIAFYKKKMPCK